MIHSEVLDNETLLDEYFIIICDSDLFYLAGNTTLNQQ